MKKSALFCCLLLCFLTIFGKDKDEKSIPRTFTLSGKVINRNSLSENRVIELIFNNVFTGRKKYNVILDDSSYFRTDIPISNVQDFYLNYGDLITLIAIPDGSLEIEINADILTAQDKKGMFRITGGTSAATNRHTILFDENVPNENYIYRHAINAVKEHRPEEYKTYIQKREAVYNDFLEKFNKQYRTDSIFRQYAKENIRYGSLEDLMRYTWTRPRYVQNDTVKIDSGYYSFLKEYTPDEHTISSFKYIGFIRELSRYMQKLTKEQTGRIIASSGETEEYQNLFYSTLTKYTSGYTLELLLTRYYLEMLHKMPYKEFTHYFNPSLITDNSLKAVLNQEILSLGQPEKNISINELQEPILKELIDSVFTCNTGKILYIDFWAPWCGPCLKEMPYSKEIQDYYKGKDVVFLFFANQCSEESWRKTIEERQLGGNHIKLTDDQYKILATLLNINGIPHYLLIDRKGKVVFTDAPRPSERKSLIQAIDKLLNQSEL